MIKRPTAGESEEDLLELQRQFLAEKAQPSANVVSKTGDKRKSASQETSSLPGTSQRDVVQLEGLPEKPPAESVPPVKKSRFKMSQERAAAAKASKTVESADDPEEMIDKHDTHMAAVLTKIIERDTRNMSVQMPHGIGLGFPSVHHLNKLKKQGEETAKKKKSLFAQQFAEAPENFGMAAGGDVRMEVQEGDPGLEVQTVIEGTGLSATFGKDEARKIHEENMTKLASMSEEEIIAEQRKLLETLDPKLVEFLKLRKTQPLKSAETDVTMEQEHISRSLKSERKEEKETVELPMKVEKDWVHMNKIEYDKLEWMKDLPKPTAGDTEVFMIDIV